VSEKAGESFPLSAAFVAGDPGAPGGTTSRNQKHNNRRLTWQTNIPKKSKFNECLSDNA
jgi:hypothetical protein